MFVHEKNNKKVLAYSKICVIVIIEQTRNA